MPITLNGDTGITTPGLTNTGSTTLVNLTTTGNTILGDQSTDTLNVANGNLVLNSSGNLGIGIGSPTQRLHVVAAGGYNATFSENSANNVRLQFYVDANETALVSGYNTTAKPMTFYTGGSLRATLDTSGNLGIGTSSPGQRLDVNGNIRTRDGGVSLTTGTTQQGVFCTYNRITGSGTDYTPTVFSETGLGMYFAVNGSVTKSMMLDASGNFHIGTTTTAGKLSVGGKIRTLSGDIELDSGQVTTNSSANALRLGVDGVEKARISSNGQLLVGLTSAPASASVGVYASFNSASYGVIGARNGTGRNTLAVLGDSNFECGYLGTSSPTGTDALVEVNGTNGVRFTVSGTERARITAGGNVGIGTSSPAHLLDVAGVANITQLLIRNGGTPTVPGNTTPTFSSPSSGTLVLSNNGSESLRVDSSGNLIVGATSFSSGGIAKTVVSAGVLSAGFQIQLSGAVASYIYGYTSGPTGFRVETTTTYPKIEMQAGSSGGVQLTSGATSWTSLSDERTKTDLVPITDAVQKVSSLRAVTGRFIKDEPETSRSFLIAQDFVEVFPQAVSTFKEKDDDTEYLGLAYTDTIPLLVAAIKELKSELDSVKTELAALKGN